MYDVASLQFVERGGLVARATDYPPLSGSVTQCERLEAVGISSRRFTAASGLCSHREADRLAGNLNLTGASVALACTLVLPPPTSSA